MMNWTPNHDPRNREYPVAELLPAAVNDRYTEWPTVPVMNQGSDGACVGYAIAAAARRPDDAERIYAVAKTLDQWAGEAYAGTSVTAGGKAAHALEITAGYRWCFGHEDVIDTLLSIGPVVLGLYWTGRMMHPVNGLMEATGPVIGGHCTVATAYDPASPYAGGRPAVKIQNSYGTAWGIDGAAWLPVNDLITALQRQGEAMVLA